MNAAEYVVSVSSLIRTVFRPDDLSGGMTVASLGGIAQQRLGAARQYGFSKFKDVLREIELTGAIRIGNNSKQALSIWIASESALLDKRPPFQKETLSTRTTFTRLSKHLWYAFVSHAPTGRRYFSRITGEVRVGVLEPLDGDWIEIVPINVDEERIEAKKFIEDHGLAENEAIVASLLTDRWYTDFPTALQSINSSLSANWKRSRSNRVMTMVERWRELNGIEVTLVYGKNVNSVERVARSAENIDLRGAILSALGHMSTESLLELHVPAKYLISVLRPDLTSK